MSLKQALTLAIDWLDHETANIPNQTDGDIHDTLHDAGIAFELSIVEDTKD